MMFYSFFFFKQKTAYEMRISDWSSDVCSSDLLWRRQRYSRLRPGVQPHLRQRAGHRPKQRGLDRSRPERSAGRLGLCHVGMPTAVEQRAHRPLWLFRERDRRLQHHALATALRRRGGADRSEEHTSELQSLMRISYAVFCLKIKKTH